MMIAFQHFRMLGLLALLTAAYKPKVTIAAISPHSFEELSETVQSPNSVAGPSEPPRRWKTSSLSPKHEVAQQEKVLSQNEPVSTRSDPSSQPLVAERQDQSNRKRRNPTIETDYGSKGHGHIPVSEPQPGRTKMQKHFDEHRETLTEMENQYKSLKNDMEVLRQHFHEDNDEVKSTLEKLIEYPNKHFSRLFENRLGKLGGIGPFIPELASKPETVSMPEALAPRSNQVENSAQASELHHDSKVTILRDDPLQLVKEIANINMVQDLRDMFRRIVNTADDNPEHQATAIYKQTCYDRMVFQVLNYMYKFQLISTHEMRSYFGRPGTLELTWQHLSRIFQKSLNGIRAYHAFIPQIDFIAREWVVDHLGECLAGLTKKEQSYLVYKALQWTIEDLDGIQRTPESASITESFRQEHLFRNYWALERPSSDIDHQQDTLVRANFEKSIALFQNFPNTSPEGTVTPETKNIEFLVNFHILHFFKTYGRDEVKKTMKQMPSPDLFDFQFSHIALGLETFQLLKWKYDYDYFLAYRGDFREKIPISVSGFRKMKLEKELTKTQNQLNDHIEKTDLLQSVHQSYNKWSKHVPVENILCNWTPSAECLKHWDSSWDKNMWLLQSAAHVRINTENHYLYIVKLAQHLTHYYDVRRWDFGKPFDYKVIDWVRIGKYLLSN